MLETIKNSSLMTKLLYLFAFILFVAWVLPKINSYYSNVNKYQKSKQEIETLSLKHNLSMPTKVFSETLFKQNSQLLFSKVEVQKIAEKTYEVDITMEKEDLKDFHTFIETIALRYYVEIIDELEFKAKDDTINVKMKLKAF